MISVLPIVKIITVIAVCYAALVTLVAALVWWLTGDSGDVRTIASWAFSGATALQLALLIVINWAWRGLWRLIPSLNKWVFPDLNGAWDMTIEWHGPVAGGSGKLKAEAIVRLDLLKISIDVISKNSTSHTLAVTPQKDPESKYARLIYVFRVAPRGVAGPDGIPYRAAAVLNHYAEEQGEILRGKYWTERQTVGEYTLRRSVKK